MSFKINHITPVIFGEGTSGQTGEYLFEDGIKRLLCVCDKGVKTAGIAETVLDSIKEKDIYGYSGSLFPMSPVIGPNRSG